MCPETRAGGPHAYSAGYVDRHDALLSRGGDSAFRERVAPHITRGARILDLGCGRGHLTVLMAEIAPDGEAYGVDINEGFIESAAGYAAERGSTNVHFKVADALTLPFEDCFFDVVHANDVLAWIPDIAAALNELRRVLKPDGTILLREMIIGAAFAYPMNDDERSGWDIFIDLMEAEDAHPQLGRELKHHLHEAGFTAIRMAGSIETYSDDSELDILRAITTEWFLSFDVTEAAKLYGAATEQLFEDVAKAADQWRQSPGAFAGIAYGEAVAVRPHLTS